MAISGPGAGWGTESGIEGERGLFTFLYRYFMGRLKGFLIIKILSKYLPSNLLLFKSPAKAFKSKYFCIIDSSMGNNN